MPRASNPGAKSPGNSAGNAGAGWQEERAASEALRPHVTQETFDKVERAKREWEATADSLSELICLLDDHGRIIRANRAVEGWKLGNVQDLPGVSFHDLLHPACKSASCPLSAFLGQARSRNLQNQPAELETYDGVLQRFVFMRVRPVHERRALTPRTSVIVVQDITERKHAEQALQSHAARLAAMNEIGQAILAARSPEDIAQAALSRICRLVPYASWASVTLSDPNTGQLIILAATSSDGRPALNAGRTLPSDTASVRFPLVADGEFVGRMDLGGTGLEVLPDEHHLIAHEVASLLAVAISQARLNWQLEQANRGLRDAIRSKDEMIQNVSHELRTPLTIIQGYTQLLRDGRLGDLSAEQEEALQAIEGHSRRLCSMVERLLTLQTLDGLRPTITERLDLTGLIMQSSAYWRVHYQAAGVELRLELDSSPLEVEGDGDLLSQVIYNLLDNALKFSAKGGCVTIRAYPEDDELTMVISDEGIGIPPDKLERIFERFYQVDGGLSRSYGGMGIGLALCRKIAEFHNGRITAYSAGTGQGSAFYVTLPAAARPRTPEAVPSAAPAHQQ